MTGAHDLARMVPGFEFLEGLMKNAGAAVPAMGQWIAPTLDPEVLDKRIGELRTVQFWLEQNARLLATTIQALEVQRMTLSTLQTMNLPLSELGEALRIRTPAPPPPAPPPAPAPAPQAAAPAEPPAEPAAAGAARSSIGGIDPMQWWGALTQQFTEIAAKALKEVGVEKAAAADPPAGEPASAPAAAKKAPARKRAAAPRKRSG